MTNPQIAAGGYHTLILKADGAVWAWGRNGNGQLGDDTATENHSPVRIGSSDNWITIAAGDYHSIALKSDGSLLTWGYNFYGQLGDGTTTDRYFPDRMLTITLPGSVRSDFNRDGFDDLAGLNDAGNIFYTIDLSSWSNIPGILNELSGGYQHR